MGSKEEWKEIEEYIKIKDSEKVEDDGVELIKKLEELIKTNNDPKVKKAKKVIKVSFVIAVTFCTLVFLIILFIGLYAIWQRMYGDLYYSAKKHVERVCDEKVKTISKDVDKNKNGLYVFKLKNKNIEVHAVKRWTNVQNDGADNLHKYYFERWQDKDKDKFIVDEGYETTKYYTDRTQNFLLSYDTYIVANNYQEVMDATDIIIRYLQFTNKPRVEFDCFIKYKDNEIRLSGFYTLDYNEIKGFVNQQFKAFDSLN